MGLNECSIALDDQRNTYHPGETVSGRVDYTIESPKKINGGSFSTIIFFYHMLLNRDERADHTTRLLRLHVL